MTNREYMASLDDLSLGEYINTEPWKDYALDLKMTSWISYGSAIHFWLKEEHKE